MADDGDGNQNRGVGGVVPLFTDGVRCVYSIRSLRALVLVQESAETVATFQRYRLCPRPRSRRRPTIRRRQV
jgi:hypothetical protein